MSRDVQVAITRFRRKDAPQGWREHLTLGQLLTELAQPLRVEDPDLRPGWSPGTFRGDDRAARNVETLWAIGLDDDESPCTTLEESIAFWSALDAQLLIHSTWSATADAMRWRVIVLLDRLVAADEYRLVWRWLARWASDRGHPVGAAASDPSRLWFWPAAPAARLDVYRLTEVRGPRLDVDRIVARQCAFERATARPRTRSTPPISAPRYALAALRSATDRVRSAPEGDRNARLNREAFALGRFVAADMLARADVEDSLAAAARDAGLGEREIAATLRSALDAGERGACRAAADWEHRVLEGVTHAPA